MSGDVSLPARSVRGASMAYREAGRRGDPVALFLHGNPTSSYIWRDVMAEVAPVAHCLAPDLIGFGQSDKPACEYRFFDHVQYLDAFIDESAIDSAYLIAQDWGTALAFHLAARRPAFVRGLAFMEFIRPMRSWEDFHQLTAARDLFRAFRTPGAGEKLILEQNVFIERVLPGSIERELTEQELAVYRAPFPTPESRRPIWRLPNELPIAREPADVWDALSAAQEALATADYPKLLFFAEPGALVSPDYAASYAARLPRCRVVNLGRGRHYLQEDHGASIGRHVADFIRSAASTPTCRGSSESSGI
jgi:haloalkane dehalogenase